jgi:hypothetical protein
LVGLKIRKRQGEYWKRRIHGDFSPKPDPKLQVELELLKEEQIFRKPKRFERVTLSQIVDYPHLLPTSL